MPNSYGELQIHNTSESMHHMASNSALYKFENVGCIPMFIKNYVVPSYVNGETSYKVKHSEVNRLDNISYKFYRTPELFWVLMITNDIINPFDIPEGTTLRILPLEYVQYSILRYSDADF
jgi:hypothetical protein